MFKTIIATCLLTFSCSSGSLKKIETPKNALIGNTYVLNSSYTLRDSFDYATFLDNFVGKSLDGVPVFGHTLNIVKRTYGDIYVFGGISGNNFYETYLFDSLTISCTYSKDTYNDYNFINFDITLNLRDSTMFSSSFDLINDDVTNIATLKDVTAFYYFEDVFENLVISFDVEYYLTGDDLLLFDLFFSPNGNRYVQYYNGYYHYGNGTWYRNNLTPFNYKYGAYYMFQSYLFDSYSYSTSNSVVSFYSSNSSSYQFNVYNNGTYINSSNINITGLLPQVVRTNLSTVGSFRFVDDTPNSTWYEMILSVMDAPIYYLKNLLGFELFGIELFVALASLLTLVLVLVVVKKVI